MTAAGVQSTRMGAPIVSWPAPVSPDRGEGLPPSVPLLSVCPEGGTACLPSASRSLGRSAMSSPLVWTCHQARPAPMLCSPTVSPARRTVLLRNTSRESLLPLELACSGSTSPDWDHPKVSLRTPTFHPTSRTWCVQQAYCGSTTRRRASSSGIHWAVQQSWQERIASLRPKGL